MITKLVSLLLVVLSLSSFADEKSITIPANKAFVSPDKSKSIKLLERDRMYYYAIKDEGDGKTSMLDANFTPVFAIAWSLDSKSIFVVVHVAKGAIVEILHLTGDQWKKYTINVPEERFHESIVLDWNIESTLLHLVCKVGLEKDNGQFYEYYKVTFDVDPSTGKTSNLKKRSITAQECFELKSKFDTYPMAQLPPRGTTGLK
jgi:hypothetical protein